MFRKGKRRQRETGLDLKGKNSLSLQAGIIRVHNSSKFGVDKRIGAKVCMQNRLGT